MAEIVLSVDGDAAFLCLRNEILRKAKFEVIEVAAGADALKLASEMQPALIVLAVESPSVGFSVCQRLKANPRTATIPVLNIARPGEPYRGYLESFESGADAYLQDPVPPPVLIAVATGLIRASCGARGSGKAHGDEASNRLAALVDSIPDEVWFADSQHRFTLANASALREFHLGASPLVDVEEFARSLEVFRADGSPRPVEEAPPLRALRGETVRDQEEIVRTPGRGELRHRQVSAAPVLDAAGNIAGSVSVVRDITDHKRAEEKVRQSEEGYRTLFDTLIEGFCIIEVILDADVPVDYRFLEINPAFERQTGLKNARGRLMRELVPDHEAYWFKIYGQVALTGQPARFVNEAKALNRWYDVSAYRVGGPESRKVAILFNDITEARRAEEALRKSEGRLSFALETTGTGGWDLDLVDHTASRSPLHDRIFGYESVLPQWTFEMFLEHVLSEDREEVSRKFSEAVQTQNDWDFECRIRRTDGEVRWIWAVGRYRRDAAGDARHMAGVVQDITEGKRASAALRQSEERYQALFDRSLDCVYLTDFEGHFLDANQAALDLIGYRREDLTELSFSSLLEDDQVSTAMETIQEVISTGRQQNPTEFQLRCKDGKYAFVETQASLIYRDGKPFAVQGIARDISERKRAEGERSRLLAQLHQAQKMESVGRLAGGVAHDFNNLLTVINGYSKMMLCELESGDPLRDSVEEIHKAGERAAGLTRQLLAFSRKQVLEPRRLDVNRVVTEMRPMLERLMGEDVEVRVALHAESGTVHADPHQLEQVVMNMAVNSRDAMPRGGKLLIETTRVERDESNKRSDPEGRTGSYVMLAVSDTGVGMDEETKHRIFEPFFTTKEVGKGTGLGLSMVQGIVAQSGGFVEVYSEKGNGTIFKVYLPALADVAADAERAAALPVRGGKETVLVVEDQAEVRGYAVAVLKGYGYRVIHAENAGDALLICEREHIDLLLTDVIMPNLSGPELAERLAKLQSGVKVLLMSGYTDNANVHHGVLEDAAPFIQKPFSPEELAGKVRAVLGPAARILVADDEAGVRSFLRKVLEGGGYEVIEAADGKQAFRQALAGGVELVITDLVMPEQEGIETIRALRRDAPGVRIIAISGAFEGQFLNLAKLLGAAAVLNKPVSAELLLSSVAEVLKRRR